MNPGVRVDTAKVLDRCYCGARAGFKRSGTGYVAACCDCPEATTEIKSHPLETVVEWNLLQRKIGGGNVRSGVKSDRNQKR